MAIKYEYEVDGNTLRAVASGFDEDLLDTLKYSLGIVRACFKHKCSRVLLDERKLDYKLDTGDTFNLAQTVVANVPALAWIAIVTHGANMPDAQFFETTANNRGLHVRFFETVEEAETWLSEK